MARVILTQPQPRVQSIAAALRESGHEVATLSFTRIVFEPDASLADRLAEYDWVIAVSPAAVAALAQSVPRGWPGAGRAPGLGLVGPGSLAALRQTGLDITRLQVCASDQPPYDAAALLRLAPFDRPRGLRILVLRGDGGREDWIIALREAGARVEVHALYRRERMVPDLEACRRVSDWMNEPQTVYCVVTQSETAKRLRELPDTAALGSADRRDVVLAIHPRIAQSLERAGFAQVRVMAPGQKSLMAALE